MVPDNNDDSDDGADKENEDDVATDSNNDSDDVDADKENEDDVTTDTNENIEDSSPPTYPALPSWL